MIKKMKVLVVSKLMFNHSFYVKYSIFGMNVTSQINGNNVARHYSIIIIQQFTKKYHQLSISIFQYLSIFELNYNNYFKLL